MKRTVFLYSKEPCKWHGRARNCCRVLQYARHRTGFFEVDTCCTRQLIASADEMSLVQGYLDRSLYASEMVQRSSLCTIHRSQGLTTILLELKRYSWIRSSQNFKAFTVRLHWRTPSSIFISLSVLVIANEKDARIVHLPIVSASRLPRRHGYRETSVCDFHPSPSTNFSSRYVL